MSSAGTAKTENLWADVVVMGSGGGLAAAVAAAEAGASVILLEKEGTLGGYTRQAGGIMGCESPVQERQNITVTRDEVFQRFVDWNHWNRIDPRVVRAFVNKAGDTIRWLEAKGVKFELMETPSGPSIIHLPVGHGDALQKALIKNAKDLGVKMLLRTSGRKILRGAGGNVTGVMAAKGRQEFRVTAKAVIIATGGFGDNKKLLKKYCPDYYDGMPVDQWPHHAAHSGDGLLMAEAIGAALADSVPNYHLGPYYPGFLYPFLSLSTMIMNPHTIWLNKKGRRFISEAGYGGMVAGNAILLQPDKVMYSVFDDEIRKDVQGGRSSREGVPGKGFPGLAEELQEQVRKGGVKIADSWDEIAGWIGAAPADLKAEIDEYNSFCDKGRDNIFSKDRQYLKPLGKAPFYAMRCYARVGETLGGIKVNERMEVLDTQGDVIPGVYAAGVVADGSQGQTYGVGGCAMGFAVNSGRIAGENAAMFVGNS